MTLYIAVITLAIPAAECFDLSDRQYHAMPQLFVLDDWERCMAQPRSAFCMGSFDLLPHSNSPLLDTIKEFSENKYHFNHTHIHRGLCLQHSCSHIQGTSLRNRFQRCVENITLSEHGLSTNLTKFEYCRTNAKTQRQVDQWDVAFLYVLAVIVAMNIVGTGYDWVRNKDVKPIPYLIAWSLPTNWARLTADHSGGDPRLNSLAPLRGMKALTLILVMLAHATLAYHYTYIYNPRFLEKSSHEFLSAYLQNGSSIVQTFIMTSCFLFAYNLLLYMEKQSQQELSFKMLPKILLHRVARILPIYILVVSLATTWWPLAGDGPLWSPLVGAESNRCRKKWWSYLIFANNFVKPDERCLIHTWFIAVDMQLYIVCTLLLLILTRRPQIAVKMLAVLTVAAAALNFGISYYWQLKPMVSLMYPEFMRTQFAGEMSFEWLYSAPWDSLPSALIGLTVAFLLYRHQQNGYRPVDSWVMVLLYRLSVPAMFAWVASGYWVKSVTHPVVLSLHAALDRPGFMLLTAFAMYGFINKIDSVWWKFLSWRGWGLLDKMSLSVFMIHWLFTLMILALKTTAVRSSIYDISGPWFQTMFLAYWAALPLHLMVELPAQRFLMAVFR